MKKLNICLISLATPPDSHDGAARFFHGIYNYLKQKGHKIILLTGKWNFDINDRNIIQFNLIKKRFLWFPKFCLNIIKFLNSHNFDIVHGNGPKGAFPIVFSKHRRFISTIHDLGPFELKFTRIPIEKLLIRFVSLRSTFITTCSNSIKKELKLYMPNIESKKIINLYSAIDNRFKPVPDLALKLKMEMKLNGPIVLYIGRIAHYKGVEDIINAYYIAKKDIPNLCLLLGGKPDYKMETKYQEWKKKFPDINFIGFIPENQLPIYYNLGDVFVTYSYGSEGFGLTPIEAIASGTPVICSSLPAYKEILEGNAIFIPPRKPDLLAEEIVHLLTNEDLRQDLIKSGLNYIKRYSWDSVGKRLEKLYIDLLGKSSKTFAL